MKQQMIVVKCPACGQAAPMRHLHNEAHGISGTHMDGSERFECSACGYTLSREEAEGRDMEYTIDVAAVFNSEGYDLTEEIRLPQDLKREGISMRNLRGDFIK